MNKKRVIIISVFILFILGLGLFYFLFKAGFEDDVNITEHQQLIKSDLGDEFLIEFTSRDFPRIQTVISINDSYGNMIEYFVTRDEFHEEKIVTILDTPSIRCYMIYNTLIYSYNNIFQAIYINSIDETNPKDKVSFIEVAKTLVSTKEWRWLKICGGFLLKSGDSDIRETFERYANDQFTKEELEINENSDISRDYIRLYSKQALKQ